MNLETNILTKKKTVPVKLPNKRGINLAQTEKHTKSILTVAIGAVAIAACAGAAAKFGVIDQYAKLNAAEAQYNSIHSSYVEMQNALTDYDAVETEYRTYSRKWLTDDADEDDRFVSVDRKKVLDMMQRRLMLWGRINSVSVSEDMMLVTMSAMNLKEISDMVAAVRLESIVKSVALTIAETERDPMTDKLLDFSLLITLQPDGEEAAK